MWIILLCAGLICGAGVCYFILRPRLNAKIYLNTLAYEQNKEIEETNKRLRQEQTVLQQDLVIFEKERAKLEGRNMELQKQISQTEETAKETTEIIYGQAYEIMSENLSAAAIKLASDYKKAEEECQAEYLKTLEDTTKSIVENYNEVLEKVAFSKAELLDLSSKVAAAVAANIREEEKKNGTNFYTLEISDIDIQEVKKLREIIPYLRNPRPVSKIIWESYYRNATTDLVNRVVGAGSHTGIYRITCLLDNKSYIGQAVSIGERFKQHIKCGLGIDTPQNKLYQAMMKQGVENFTFEVIEECPSSELNKQEKYWIEFYQSNIYGYNMSSGGSRGVK